MREEVLCVFITAVPITKLFARGGVGEWRTCATRDYEPRPVWTRPRTNERGGERSGVNEGEGEEGERERERAGEVRLDYSLGY